MQVLRPIQANECEPSIRIAQLASIESMSFDMPMVRCCKTQDENAPSPIEKHGDDNMIFGLYDVLNWLTKEHCLTPDIVALE